MDVNGRLAGKCALVTGAETGIGREIALEFGRQGADVAVHFALSAEAAARVAESIRGMGRRAETFRADFAEAEEVFRLAREAEAFLGRVDCLVNNAGITIAKPFAEVTVEDYDLLFRINARAQFFLAQAVARGMAERGRGAICNMTSIHALFGGPLHTAYAATKGAIVAQTRTMALELARKAIRVNAIAPGWILVERHLAAQTEQELRHRAAEGIPAGRIGLPSDVARLAAFLCSEEAEHIVGQTIGVDGGTSALMSLFGADGRQP